MLFVINYILWTHYILTLKVFINIINKYPWHYVSIEVHIRSCCIQMGKKKFYTAPSILRADIPGDEDYTAAAWSELSGGVGEGKAVGRALDFRYVEVVRRRGECSWRNAAESRWIFFVLYHVLFLRTGVRKDKKVVLLRVCTYVRTFVLGLRKTVLRERKKNDKILIARAR